MFTSWSSQILAKSNWQGNSSNGGSAISYTIKSKYISLAAFAYLHMIPGWQHALVFLKISLYFFHNAAAAPDKNQSCFFQTRATMWNEAPISQTFNNYFSEFSTILKSTWIWKLLLCLCTYTFKKQKCQEWEPMLQRIEAEFVNLHMNEGHNWGW